MGEHSGQGTNGAAVVPRLRGQGRGQTSGGGRHHRGQQHRDELQVEALPARIQPAARAPGALRQAVQVRRLSAGTMIT